MTLLKTPIFILSCLVLLLACNTADKQKTKASAPISALENLTETTIAALGHQQMALDGVSIPVYKLDGTQLTGMALMEEMMTGKYTPVPFVDDSKEIKAYLLKVQSEEEALDKINLEDSEWIGQKSPPMSLVDLNDKKYTLQDLKDKVVVMNFWFINCKPCVKEIPELNDLVQKYQAQDVVFLGLARDSADKLSEFLQTKEFLYNIVPNSQEYATAFDVSAYPTHIIIDKEQNIVVYFSGLAPKLIEAIDIKIASLI